MEQILSASLITGGLIWGARHIYKALQGHAGVTYEGMMRSAFVANFSRFGDLSEYKIAVMDDNRGYFVRDNSLWSCEVMNDEVLRHTAKPVDVLTIDSSMLKEIMAAVDALNTEIQDLGEEEE